MSNILKSTNKAQIKKENSQIKSELLFRNKNYIILLVAIFILFLGFILLSGGGSDDYNYQKEIFNFQRFGEKPDWETLDLFDSHSKRKINVAFTYLDRSGSDGSTPANADFKDFHYQQQR